MAVVTISLDVDSATGAAKLRDVGSELKKTGEEVTKTKSLVSSVFQGLGQGIGIEAVHGFFETMKSGGEMLSEWVKGAGEYAAQLVRVQDSLGLTSKAQAVLQAAGEASDVSWESQEKSIAKLAKVLDQHPEKLGRIGLSYDQIKNLAPERQFEEIGKKVVAIEDPMRRLAVAQEFFGKGAAAVLPMFSGAIDKARADVERLGLSLDENAVRPLKDLRDEVNLGAKVWDFFTKNIAGVIAQSEPLQVLVKGLIDMLGSLSKATKDNTGTLRSFVDEGVLWVAKGLVTLVDTVQLVMDVWDGLKLAGRAVYTVVIDLAVAVTKLALAYSYIVPGGALLRDTLRENITFLQAEKDAQTKAADEIINANTKRTNQLAIVRTAVEDLSKAVEASVGKTHQATEAEIAHGKAIGGTASELIESAAAHKKFEENLKKIHAAAMEDMTEGFKNAEEERKQHQAEEEKLAEEFEKNLTKIQDAAIADRLEGLKIAEEERKQAIEDADQQVLENAAAFNQSLKDKQTADANAWSDLGDNVGAVTDLLQTLGFSSDSALVKLGNAVASTSKLIADATAKGYYTIADLANAAANIFKNGSALGGAASGAMIGFSMGGGPIGALIGGAAGGLLGFLGGGGKKAEEAAKQKAAQDEAVKNAISGLDQLSQRLDKFKTETLNSGVAGVNSMFTYLASKTDVSAERLSRMGSIGFGVFQMLRNSGMSIVDAMNAMGPAFDAALKTGADGFGAKFAELAAFRKLVLDNADMVNAAESIGDVINAYRVNGMLTQQAFDDVIGENKSMIADMLAQGFTLDQALAVNAESLYAIYKAEQDLGLTVDATTQSYIDQAETAGLFDNMKDPMEELVKIQQMMLEITAALVKLMGGDLPAAVQAYIDKLNKIPTSVNTNVNTNYSHSGDPGGNGNSGGGDGGDTPSAAMGGISTRPQLYQVHGTPSNPEVIAPVGALIRGIGQAVANGARGVQVGTLQVIVQGASGSAQGTEAGKAAVAVIIQALKDNAGGIREQIAVYVPVKA